MSNSNVSPLATRQGVSRWVPVWAGFAILLFASTWKLWTPQSEFPQIPFLEGLINVPGWVDWVAVSLAGLGLIGCLFPGSRSRVITSLLLFATATLALILLNQHRFQPWTYQFVVFAFIMATARPAIASRWMRWIVISIYLYSAISKFDYQFVHTVGDQILAQWFQKLGVETANWPVALRHSLVIGFPVAEALIGLALMFSPTRRFAWWVAVMMHACLVFALIGNVDGFGVIIWNVYFIVQAYYLFGPRPRLAEQTGSTENDQTSLPSSNPPGPSGTPGPFPLEWVATIIAMIVLLFPLTQPLGFCDHWPAWQVYAPRSSRAKLVRLASDDPQIWDDFPAWSTTTLGVPLYPQARFQLAVAMAAQQRYAEAATVPIEVSGVSDRWTGSRETEVLTGDRAKMLAERYRLNLKARTLWTDAGPN